VQFQDEATFIGVAWTGDDDSFQGFIDKHGLTFPQISDDPGDVFDRFEVSYQPAIVIVNTDGSTELITGAVDEELLGQIVSEAN
jgi:peroxiredoxin